MKQISILFFLSFVIFTGVKAQSPPLAFNYSAVARNSQGLPIVTSSIAIQISILKGNTTGPSQYTENHLLTTDQYGLFNLVIGSGLVQSGSMSSIDWSNDSYYLQVSMDASGGTNFLLMGVSQLVSVPYALHAKTASNGFSGNYNDLTNKPTAISSFSLDANNQSITNVANPTSIQDVATKSYVDQMITVFENNGMSVVNFTANAVSAVEGTLITFTDNSKINPTSWQWDFGDGTSSTLQNPTHTYNTVGSYTVTLTATNGIITHTKTKTNYITITSAMYGQFTDTRDGYVYQTVTIGGKEWFAENLKYLPSVNDGSSLSSSVAQYFVYGYTGTDVATAKATSNYNTYGVIYNFTASTGACPTGWHLPSETEWQNLAYTVGYPDPGSKLKEAGTAHWNAPNTGATNSSGFTALPGGLFDGTSFSGIGEYTYFIESQMGNIWGLAYNNWGFTQSYSYTNYTGSIRCIRD